jgi:hypothetical protein
MVYLRRISRRCMHVSSLICGILGIGHSLRASVSTIFYFSFDRCICSFGQLQMPMLAFNVQSKRSHSLFEIMLYLESSTSCILGRQLPNHADKFLQIHLLCPIPLDCSFRQFLMLKTPLRVIPCQKRHPLPDTLAIK